MQRHFWTMKRVARGLKLTAMLLFGVVAYAAMLKRGKIGSRLFFFFFFLAAGYAALVATAPTSAKAPLNAQAAPQAPAKQIYTRSNRALRSELLGVSGQAAYIVSSVGTRSGILITDITSGGTASRVGITSGDVLLTLNQRVVTTATDADRILSDSASGSVKVSFAHPSEDGLQLYNTAFNYANREGGVTGSGGRSMSHSGSSSSKFGASLSSQIAGAESLAVNLVNQDRAREHAAAVSSNSALAALALAHAQDMATRHFFSHVNPDGLNPQDRANKVGAGPVFENISFATDVTDLNAAARDAERTMMGEPPNQPNHRANIINPVHKTVGIGVAVSKDGVFYMAQEFSNGSP